MVKALVLFFSIKLCFCMVRISFLVANTEISLVDELRVTQYCEWNIPLHRKISGSSTYRSLCAPVPTGDKEV